MGEDKPREWWYCPVCAAVFSLPGTCRNSFVHSNRPRMRKLAKHVDPKALEAAHALGGRDAVRALALELVQPPIRVMIREEQPNGDVVYSVVPKASYKAMIGTLPKKA